MKKVKKMVCVGLAVAVFEKPTPGSARVGQLRWGQEVEVARKQDGWARINQPEGWVRAGHLEPCPPKSDAASDS